eukprot:scaffold176333_cov28-Tisochrysis_lutea.AAC.1
MKQVRRRPHNGIGLTLRPKHAQHIQHEVLVTCLRAPSAKNESYCCSLTAMAMEAVPWPLPSARR